MPNDGAERPAVNPGFSAQVNGVSIPDLVQMYCQTRSRAAIEVRSGFQVGYLFFDNGRLIHAELGALVGESAFEKITAFSAGAFQPSLRAWPRQASIDCSVEALLLRIAQAQDEAVRGVGAEMPTGAQAAGNAVRVSVTKPVGVPRRDPQAEAPESAPRQDRSQPKESGASGVRVDPKGELVSRRGGRAEGLTDLVAFAGPLLQSIGHELGLGETRGVDLFGSGDVEVLLRRELDGSWVGAVGQAQELAELRRRIGDT